MATYSIRIAFEPRDLWIGLFWSKVGYVLRLYICIVPCLPIIIEIRDND